MIRTYLVLLFLCLGACPHEAHALDQKKPLDPPFAALLPAEQAWIATLPLSPSASGAIDDVRVYIPLEGEHFIALDRATGKTVWSADIESVWPPLVHDGVVYIAASDELHALDAATGDHKWRVSLGRGAMAPLSMTASVIVALVTPDEVWAFSPVDGHRVWGQSLGGSVGPAAMAVDARAIFVSLGERLARVNLADGAVRWDVKLPGMLSAPSVARDRVFVGSTSNDFFAVNAESGAVTWVFHVGGDVVGAAIESDVIYVVSLDNLLRALRRGSGNQIWKRALTTRPLAPPRVMGGIVVVEGISPHLSAFNAKTGAPLGTFDALSDPEGMPLIAPALTPFSVSMVAVMRNGQATGHRSVAMMFREKALEPLIILPGHALTKETAGAIAR